MFFVQMTTLPLLGKNDKNYYWHTGGTESLIWLQLAISYNRFSFFDSVFCRNVPGSFSESQWQPHAFSKTFGDGTSLEYIFVKQGFFSSKRGLVLAQETNLGHLWGKLWFDPIGNQPCLKNKVKNIDIINNKARYNQIDTKYRQMAFWISSNQPIFGIPGQTKLTQI